MPEFADEARSRVAHLLRMAGDDLQERQLMIEHAHTTPDPPVMAWYGIATQGCSRCRRTMWRQWDRHGPLWVCAACGHIVDS